MRVAEGTVCSVLWSSEWEFLVVLMHHRTCCRIIDKQSLCRTEQYLIVGNGSDAEEAYFIVHRMCDYCFWHIHPLILYHVIYVQTIGIGKPQLSPYEGRGLNIHLGLQFQFVAELVGRGAVSCHRSVIDHP